MKYLKQNGKVTTMKSLAYATTFVLLTLSTACGPKPPDRREEVLGKKSSGSNATQNSQDKLPFDIDCAKGIEQLPKEMTAKMDAKQLGDIESKIKSQCSGSAVKPSKDPKSDRPKESASDDSSKNSDQLEDVCDLPSKTLPESIKIDCSQGTEQLPEMMTSRFNKCQLKKIAKLIEEDCKN